MRRSREPAWCVGGGHAKAVITGGWKSLSRCAGVTRVLLLAGFAAQRVIDYAASTPLKARFGLEIEVTIEPQRAGTGGAVWYARDSRDFAIAPSAREADWSALESMSFGAP